MTLFDLLFLVCVFVLIVSLARLTYVLIRRKPASRLAVRILACIGAYFAALLIVSASAPARIYQPQEPQCFDEWCIAVQGVERHASSLAVHLTVTSQARRVTQREHGVHPILVDHQGRAFQPVATFGAPIDTAIAPAERFPTGCTFHPAPDSRGLALVIQHEGPGPLIIGDRQSLLHRRSRMVLPAQ